MGEGPPQLPDRPSYSRRPAQPLRLPSFTTINGQNGLNVPQQQHLQSHQNQMRHESKRRPEGNLGRNVLYRSMLESIEVDDMEVLTELVNKLLKVRSENEILKKAMWNRVSTLSDKLNNEIDDNSEDISIEELRQIYESKKKYNQLLKETVEQYTGEIERVLDAAVCAKVEAGETLISKIREDSDKVEESTKQMWESWNQVAIVLNEAGDLAHGVSESMKYVNEKGC